MEATHTRACRRSIYNDGQAKTIAGSGKTQHHRSPPSTTADKLQEHIRTIPGKEGHAFIWDPEHGMTDIGESNSAKAGFDIQ